MIWQPAISQNDTTHLSPFVVTESTDDRIGNAGRQIMDSLQRILGRQGTLADLLVRTSPVAMRYYGPGQLASAAFRGASASQTVVVWNGIRINNPMLMQTDLSSIPIAFVDNGRILFGNSALKESSGAFGGVISLSTNLMAEDTQSVFVMIATGSYGLNMFNAGSTWKNGNIRSKTIYYSELSGNDFRYLDNFLEGNPVKRRVDASWSARGILHQSGIICKNNRSGGFLISGQQRFINIPYPIHQPQGKYSQIQSEDTWRMILHGSARRKEIDFGSATGLQYGLMHYSESRSGTEAEHITANFQQRFDADGYSGKNHWKLSAGYEMQHAITSAFEDDKSRQIISLYTSLLRTWRWFLRYGADIRSEFIPDYGFDVMPSVYAAAVIGNSRNNIIKATVLRNRQIPGLNDLYWVPGGNPDLRPEEGFGGELTWEGIPFKSGNWTMNGSFTFFHQIVNRKITWLPDSTSVWSAGNIGKVKMNGAEMMLNISMVSGRNLIEIMLKAQYTNAERVTGDDQTNGFKLVYIPCMVASSVLRVATPYFLVSAETSITGKRFTNAANTSYLPAYSLTDIRVASGMLPLRFITINVFGVVSNVFDKQYQAIAWYPMPGRTFSVGLSLKFES